MFLGDRRNVVIVIGETGVGKTTLTTSMIDQYDDERGMVTMLDSQGAEQLAKFAKIDMNKIPLQKSGKYRVLSGNIPLFIDMCCKNYFAGTAKRGLVYIDDADGMSKHENPQFTDLMGGVRHKQCDVMLTFHHIWRVPKYIMDNAQILIQMKTNESIEQADINRFKKPQLILDAFKSVEEHPDKHYYEIVKLHGV